MADLVRWLALAVILAAGSGLAHATAICAFPGSAGEIEAALEYGHCLAASDFAQAGCAVQHQSADSECTPDAIPGSSLEPALVSRMQVTQIPAPGLLPTQITTYPQPVTRVPRYLTFHRLLIAHLA